MKFAIYLLLQGDPATADFLKRKPWCTLCPWSKYICGFYWEDFGGEEMLAYLAFKALLIRMDMQEIESLHAWLRRILVSRSSQTHTVNIIDLGSNWLASRARKRQEEHDGNKSPAAPAPGPKAAKPIRKKRRRLKKTKVKRKGNKGGLMHAFFHRELPKRQKPPNKDKEENKLEKKQLFKALHADYKNATPDDLASLSSIADAAKQSKGKHGFGTPASICKARALKTLQFNIFRRTQQQTSTSRTMSLYEAATSGNDTTILRLVGQKRFDRHEKRIAEQENLKTLEKFRAAEADAFRKLRRGINFSFSHDCIFGTPYV